MQHLRFSRYIKPAIILLDLAVIFGIFWLFFSANSKDFEMFSLSSILTSFLWILLSGRTKIYEVQRNLTFTLFIERVFTHCAVFITAFILVVRLGGGFLLENRRFLFFTSLFITLVLFKSIIFFFIKHFRIQGWNHRNVMFLDENPATDLLKKTLSERKDYGYKVFGHSLNSEDFAALKEFWKTNGIYEVFLSSESGKPSDKRKILLKTASDCGIRVSLVPNITDDSFFQYSLDYIETQPVYLPAKFPLDFFSNYILKRLLDIFLSVIFLAFIASWLFPIIAIIIKSEGKEPVFFRQKRYGYKDGVFTCLKFRTMYDNEFSSTKVTDENDARITPFGKFLRKTSLDETPQFLNVLFGEMSIVGPRPHMLLVDDFYKPKLERYAVRSLVKPGITGLSQVSGLRGDAGNREENMKKRILSDAFYVKNWSLGLDLVIILKTIFLVLGGDKNAK